jgi:DNA repair protein RecO (recombination protein O)
MSLTYKTRGIILKSKQYKEADRLYTVYTVDFGKQVFRAQAVKKINSKLAGHLEPLTISNLFIAEAKGFKKIAGAQAIANFLNIKCDLQKLNYVLYCIEVFDSLVKENEKDTELYKLLKNFLFWCNNNRITMLEAKGFILKLLKLLGYQSESIVKVKDINSLLKMQLNKDLQTEKFLV